MKFKVNYQNFSVFHVEKFILQRIDFLGLSFDFLDMECIHTINILDDKIKLFIGEKMVSFQTIEEVLVFLEKESKKLYWKKKKCKLAS